MIALPIVGESSISFGALSRGLDFTFLIMSHSSVHINILGRPLGGSAFAAPYQLTMLCTANGLI